MRQFDSFSSAIREGAKLRPQAFQCFVNHASGTTCAAGAGLEAIFGAGFDNMNRVYEFYPYLEQDCDTCPVCGSREAKHDSYSSIIYHLNDHHRWTREQIADWLQGVEDKLFGYETIIDMPKEQKVIAECPS